MKIEGPQTSVGIQFKVWCPSYNRVTHRLYLLGSLDELGAWSIDDALEAYPTKDIHVWKVEASVPPKSSFEWVWVKAKPNRKQVEWERPEKRNRAVDCFSGTLHTIWSEPHEVFLQSVASVELTTYRKLEEGFKLVLCGSTVTTGLWDVKEAVSAVEFPRRSGYWKAYVTFDAYSNLSFKWTVVKEKNPSKIVVQESEAHWIYGRTAWMRAVAPWGRGGLVVVVDTSVMEEPADPVLGRTDLLVRGKRMREEEIERWLAPEPTPSGPLVPNMSSTRPSVEATPSGKSDGVKSRVSSSQVKTSGSRIPSVHRTTTVGGQQGRQRTSSLSKSERLTRHLSKDYTSSSAVSLMKGKGQTEALVERASTDVVDSPTTPVPEADDREAGLEPPDNATPRRAHVGRDREKRERNGKTAVRAAQWDDDVAPTLTNKGDVKQSEICCRGTPKKPTLSECVSATHPQESPDDLSYATKSGSTGGKEGFEPRVRGRPPRHDHAPRHHNSSPRRKDPSPRHKDPSPRRKDHAPRHHNSSPRRKDPSPRHNDSSSRRKDHSPRHHDPAHRHNDSSPRPAASNLDFPNKDRRRVSREDSRQRTGRAASFDCLAGPASELTGTAGCDVDRRRTEDHRGQGARRKNDNCDCLDQDTVDHPSTSTRPEAKQSTKGRADFEFLHSTEGEGIWGEEKRQRKNENQVDRISDNAASRQQDSYPDSAKLQENFASRSSLEHPGPWLKPSHAQGNRDSPGGRGDFLGDGKTFAEEEADEYLSWMEEKVEQEEDYCAATMDCHFLLLLPPDRPPLTLGEESRGRGLGRGCGEISQNVVDDVKAKDPPSVFQEGSVEWATSGGGSSPVTEGGFVSVTCRGEGRIFCADDAENDLEVSRRRLVAKALEERWGATSTTSSHTSLQTSLHTSSQTSSRHSLRGGERGGVEGCCPTSVIGQRRLGGGTGERGGVERSCSTSLNGQRCLKGGAGERSGVERSCSTSLIGQRCIEGGAEATTSSGLKIYTECPAYDTPTFSNTALLGQRVFVDHRAKAREMERKWVRMSKIGGRRDEQTGLTSG
ncbi:uncharacterized protein LOC101860717 [Aplysia californica]|uniref:Uncharacterized protein LOC101860717 n=1 Tax=Aplysia californica TaxID=6500 RepID=A0ABM1W4J3_APLCA|nr:uncharacterized protein LOC101860717 [Aplysia californica]